MAISDHLSAADVILDASAGNKRSLLEILATEAASRLGHSRQEILDALQAREELGSTALGKGVALPHAELRGGHIPRSCFSLGSIVRSTSMPGMPSRSILSSWCFGPRQLPKAF